MKSGDVISYLQMCSEEGVNLQRGMNFRLRGNYGVILTSLRRGAPYADRIEADGRVLIYEGHDAPRNAKNPYPKQIDQPMRNPGGTLTQNGLFCRAATSYRKGIGEAEVIKVYEKIHSGIWVFNGIFRLVDAWREESNNRKVVKFRLELSDELLDVNADHEVVEHNRLIPKEVKLDVWRRDKGRCVICGSNDNLHFDHIIPYSKGGSSSMAENIQLLCARHNIAKKDKIE